MKKQRGNKTFSKARYIATSAILTALCTVILSLGSVIETMDLSFAAISALIVWIALLEFGGKTAWAIYFATSTVSMLFLPAKFAAVFFLGITGWYPMVKYSLSRKVKNKTVLWLCKLVIFNLAALASAAAVYFLGSFLGISLSEDMTAIYYLAMLGLSNFAFIITDILMDKLVIVYIYKLRDKLKKSGLIE